MVKLLTVTIEDLVTMIVKLSFGPLSGASTAGHVADLMHGPV
jgi:hypothetical protein